MIGIRLQSVQTATLWKGWRIVDQDGIASSMIFPQQTYLYEGTVITGIILTSAQGQTLAQFAGAIGPLNSGTLKLHAANGSLTYDFVPYVSVPPGTSLITIGIKVANVPLSASLFSGLYLIGGVDGEPRIPNEGYVSITGTIHFANVPRMTSAIEIVLLNSTRT